MRGILVFSWFLVGGATPCLAGGAGTSSADFLKIGLGARAVAMGGSFTAVADDASAIYWNPAGLSQLLQNEAAFLHTQWLDGIQYEYLMYAQPTYQLGTFGGSYALLEKGGIPSYDETGTPLGDISVRNSVLSAGWGKELSSRPLALGATIKWVHENLAGFTANSYATDVGAFYRAYESERLQLNAALAVRNLGTHGAFISEKGDLPRIITAGLGLKAAGERLVAGLDIVYPRDRNPYPILGGEYWVHPMVAVRAGYTQGTDTGTGFSTGVGFRMGSLQFDYAVSDFGTLGFAHRGGITYRFGSGLERLYDEGLALMRQGRFADAFLRFNRILYQQPDNKRALLRMKECRDRIMQEMKETKSEPVTP